MTYHWAYDESGSAQPVERLKDGLVLMIGSKMSVSEKFFVYVDDEPIPTPAIDWTADMKQEAIR